MRKGLRKTDFPLGVEVSVKGYRAKSGKTDRQRVERARSRTGAASTRRPTTARPAATASGD